MVTEYDRFTNFQNSQALAPDDPPSGTALDAEFNRLKITTDSLIAALDNIQRDDLELANESVGPDQLSPDLSLPFNQAAPWATATDYTERDAVFEDNKLYLCIEDHTSGTFATDLAADKWEEAIDFTAVAVGLLPENNLDDVDDVDTARVNLRIDSRTARGDADYVILTTDEVVALNAALSTTRTFTLPTAASVDAGRRLTVVDEALGVTAANTLTLARNGADTINGATSLVFTQAGRGVILESDGTSKWTIVANTQTTRVRGTQTNDNAVAGDVGEYISSTVLIASDVELTTGTTANVTSISLTAGDWDVEGNVAFNPNAATTMATLQADIGSTSATFDTEPSGGARTKWQLTFATGASQAITTGRKRFSLAATTTVYLLAQATFGVNTLHAYGFIGARRVR
jgi:hypothetical protein